MQGGAGENAGNLLSIEEIARQWVTQIGHVDPDLMGASRLQGQPQEGVGTKPSQRLVVGLGRFSVWPDLLFYQGALFCADGSLNLSAGGRGSSDTHRKIGALKFLGVELPLQKLLGVGMLRGDQQARGPPVQAVNGVKISLLPLSVVIIEQKITNCIVKMTRSGVDSHTWSLVKYHKVSVLVENIQGTGGGDNPAAPLWVGEADGQRLSGLGEIPGIDPLAIHQDSVRQPFDAPYDCAGQAQVPSEQSIHFNPGQLRSDGQFQAAAHNF